MLGFTLGEIAQHIGAETRGDVGCVIHGVASLDRAQAGELSYLTSERYRKHLSGTQASAVILAPQDAPHCTVAALVVDNPGLGYARAATLLTTPPVQHGIHPTAWISATAQVHASAWIGPQCVIEAGAMIGKGVNLGPGCVIGENSSIGEDSRLLAHVTVCHGSIIGRRALIHPGAVIGSDGFGLASNHGVWVKIPQLGRACIGDDVEIGANTTIDRGALDDTVIEDGVKLDNQVQVAHNVHIGAHTAIAGCVGIAGSARIGKRCRIGGGVGIAGHLEITDDVTVTGMSLVSKSIRTPGVYSSSVPAEPVAVWNKQLARLRRLETLSERLKALEQNRNNHKGTSKNDGF